MLSSLWCVGVLCGEVLRLFGVSMFYVGKGRGAWGQHDRAAMCKYGCDALATYVSGRLSFFVFSLGVPALHLNGWFSLGSRLVPAGWLGVFGITFDTHDTMLFACKWCAKSAAGWQKTHRCFCCWRNALIMIIAYLDCTAVASATAVTAATREEKSAGPGLFIRVEIVVVSFPKGKLGVSSHVDTSTQAKHDIRSSCAIE